GWTSGRILGAFGLAVVAGIGLVGRSRRHPNPIIEPAVIPPRAAALAGPRFGHRAVGTVGALLFAASGVWWITHIGVTPDWAGAYLPGSLLSGIGVGLMLPSLGGAATAPLPPERFATGSALYR